MLRSTRAVSFSSNHDATVDVTERSEDTTGFSDSWYAPCSSATLRRIGFVSLSCCQRSWRGEEACRTRASPALQQEVFYFEGGDSVETCVYEKTHSGSATTRALMRPSLPALASRICRRALRASFSSNPACFAVPESSSASMTVSARVLYAAVLRRGSVVEAIVEETAAVALDIYRKKE